MAKKYAPMGTLTIRIDQTSLNSNGITIRHSDPRDDGSVDYYLMVDLAMGEMFTTDFSDDMAMRFGEDYIEELRDRVNCLIVGEAIKRSVS